VNSSFLKILARQTFDVIHLLVSCRDELCRSNGIKKRLGTVIGDISAPAITAGKAHNTDIDKKPARILKMEKSGFI
jgi:hypothetical protein